ncbi:MAG: hypothetical protein ACO1OG_11935 [Devosia sp.]
MRLSAVLTLLLTLVAGPAIAQDGSDCEALTRAEAAAHLAEFAEQQPSGNFVLSNGYVLRISGDSRFCQRQLDGAGSLADGKPVWSISKFDQQGVVVVTRRDFDHRAYKRAFVNRIAGINKYILGKYMLLVEVDNTIYAVSTTQNMEGF